MLDFILPYEEIEYKNSELPKISEFQKILKDAGLVAPVRKTRGDDVMAACGQLKSASEREKKSKPL